jgi:hypothetical protein
LDRRKNLKYQLSSTSGRLDDGTTEVPTGIVRNFVSRKSWPPFPTRGEEKKIGLPSTNNVKQQTNRNIGIKMINAKDAITKSRARFPKRSYFIAALIGY